MLKLNEILQMVVWVVILILSATMIVAHIVKSNWATVFLFSALFLISCILVALSIKEIKDE